MTTPRPGSHSTAARGTRHSRASRADWWWRRPRRSRAGRSGTSRPRPGHRPGGDLVEAMCSGSEPSHPHARERRCSAAVADRHRAAAARGGADTARPPAWPSLARSRSSGLDQPRRQHELHHQPGRRQPAAAPECRSWPRPGPPTSAGTPWSTSVRQPALRDTPLNIPERRSPAAPHRRVDNLAQGHLAGWRSLTTSSSDRAAASGTP